MPVISTRSPPAILLGYIRGKSHHPRHAFIPAQAEATTDNKALLRSLQAKTRSVLDPPPSPEAEPTTGPLRQTWT